MWLSQRSYFQQLIYGAFARNLHTTEGFQALGRQLAAIARRALLSQQVGAVEQASQLMLALPISDQLESIARYYQTWCRWRQGDLSSARQFERAVEELPSEYKARALQVIGLTYQQRGELDAALPYYLDAGKTAASTDWLTLAQSQQMTAVVRGILGDHKQAVADLEKLFPLIRAISKYYPRTYYDYLNSLAVELAEVGRLNEAQAACAITLASPFADACRDWSETRDEIALKLRSASPSIVAVPSALETASVRNTQPQRKPEPRVVIYRLSANDTFRFQRSTIEFPAKALTFLNAANILDRMFICIGPRAPPVF